MSNDRLKFRAWDGERMLTQIQLYWDGEKFISGIWDFEETHIVDVVCEDLEVMQWTGLYDSEGAEIYVGDFVSAPDVYPGYYGDDPGADGVLKISWDGTTARYAGVGGNGEPHELTDWIYDDLTSTFVVVGNIYEPPSLMERANG